MFQEELNFLEFYEEQNWMFDNLISFDFLKQYLLKDANVLQILIYQNKFIINSLIIKQHFDTPSQEQIKKNTIFTFKFNLRGHT